MEHPEANCQTLNHIYVISPPHFQRKIELSYYHLIIKFLLPYEFLYTSRQRLAPGVR